MQYGDGNVTIDAATAERLEVRLRELCGLSVPGAVVALGDDTEVIEVAHGVTGLRTEFPVSARTVFQIGSITKVFTASLVMCLVDAADVDLDATVQTYALAVEFFEPLIGVALSTCPTASLSPPVVEDSKRFIFGDGQERAEWIHAGGRATRRVA